MKETETCGSYKEKNHQAKEAASTVMIKIQLQLQLQLHSLLLVLVQVLFLSNPPEELLSETHKRVAETQSHLKIKTWVLVEVEKEAQQPSHLQLQATP
jgi:hypothetical protein